MNIKKTLRFGLEIAQIVAIALIIVIPIRYFVFQPFIVRGASMEPNFHDGDYLIVDEISYRFREPSRGEVIVFRYPNDPSQRYIKRIIGLPGETLTLQDLKIMIETIDGVIINLDETDYLEKEVFSDNNSITLGRDEYYVMGDNRAASYDSRRWGALTEDEIIGRVVLRAWPVGSLDLISSPDFGTVR